MPSTDENWFVEERSLALSGAILTSRKDVRVRKDRTDGGFDFLVEIHTDDPMSAMLFAVLVKGTMSSDPDDPKRFTKRLFHDRGGSIHLPVSVFVVNVRENKACYAWVAEPLVESKRAALRIHDSATFHPLDPSAVDDIVDRVTKWYRVLSEQLTPA